MTTLEFNGEPHRRPFLKILLRIILIFAFLAGVGVCAYLGYSFYKRSLGTYGGYEVVKSVERNDGTSDVYTSYGKLLLKYSRDGAVAFNAEGALVWNGAYEMKEPIVDTCGSYVVVADQGSKLVHIFNDGGNVNRIDVEHPILKVQVANQGVVAVMMEENNYMYVTLYKPNGTVIAEFNKSVKKTGFPVSMALSHDGKKVVTSHVDISSGTVKTNIACRNFDGVGQNASDNIVGGNVYEDEIVAKVDFITNDIVCYYKDNGFVLYTMEEKRASDPITEVKFDTAINSITSSSSYLTFIVDSTNDKYKYDVVIYDLKGKKVLQKGINFEYTNLNMKGSELILYNYSECMVLNTKGTVRFQYKFDESIDYMSGISHNKYYIVTNKDIEIIKLKGAK